MDWGLGLQGLGFRVQGRVQGPGFRVGFGVWKFGVRGLGFGVEGVPVVVDPVHVGIQRHQSVRSGLGSGSILFYFIYLFTLFIYLFMNK